ncbi:hypothetical protein PTKIN_Ptkin10aG0103200 [Pterospermum kingtungense]
MVEHSHAADKDAGLDGKVVQPTLSDSYDQCAQLSDYGIANRNGEQVSNVGLLSPLSVSSNNESSNGSSKKSKEFVNELTDGFGLAIVSIEEAGPYNGSIRSMGSIGVDYENICHIGLKPGFELNRPIRYIKSAGKDNDIACINRTILNEAEANWEVGHHWVLSISTAEFRWWKSLRIASWNIRGIGGAEKRRAVRRLLVNKKFDMFFIQESKLKEMNHRVQRWIWVMSLSSVKQWRLRGILSCNFKCGFGNAYAPNDDNDSEALWEELYSIINASSIPWCLAGDFNVVRTVEEKIRMTLNQVAMDKFSDFIEGCSLVDLPLVGCTFTWCSNRSPPTFCHLDHFLEAVEFLEVFQGLVQNLLPRSLSDHNIISLENKEINWGLKPFRFYNYWFDCEGFQDMVVEQWKYILDRRGGSANLWLKLRDLKVAIKSWYEAVSCRTDKLPSTYLGYPWEQKGIQWLCGIHLSRSLSRGYRDGKRTDFHLVTFAENTDSLWRRVIVEKYGGENCSLLPDIKCYRRFSNQWRNIIKPLITMDEFAETLSSGMGFVVGDGSRISFWNCEWIPGILLKYNFPRMFALSTLKESKIKEFGYFENDTWMLKGRVAVKENLRVKNIGNGLDVHCVLCKRATESISHLFFVCPVSWGVWSHWCWTWGIQWVSSSDPWQFFEHWLQLLPPNRCDKLWRMFFGAIARALWPNVQICMKDVFICPGNITICKKKTRDRPSASSGKSGPAGIEGVMRSHASEELARFSKSVGIEDSSVAELIAICEAFLTFIDSPYVYNCALIVESDSKNAVTWVNSPLSAPWRVLNFINHIECLKRKLRKWEVVHIFKEANQVVDQLAKEGVS